MLNVLSSVQRLPVLCLVIALLFTPTNGADPVYSDPTISDTAGNTADQNAVISWADLPAGTAYNSGNPSRVSEGLAPYYDFMHNFVGSVFPKDIPDSIIENAVNGTFDKIISNYSDYITIFIGYGICVVIGVLFIFIFPIVACCFCCCRCCGNCGGKMFQEEKDATNKCKRNTFAVLLAIMLTFTTVGVVCVYLNNENTSTAINGISSTGKDTLDDIKVFVNNTVDQANHIAKTNYEFLKKALDRDIDNIAYLVGIPLRTDIEDQTNIRTVLTQAYALNDDLIAADGNLTDVNTKLDALEIALSALDSSLSAVKTTLDTVFADCGAACPDGSKPDYNSGTTVGVDSNQFPNLTQQTQDMNDAKNQNMSDEVDKGAKEVDDIPWRVHNDSETSRNDMKTSINNLQDDIDPMLDKITDINDKIYGANATVNLNEYEDKIKEYGDLAAKYDKYRWYGGIGLSGIILLIVLLGGLGLTCGVVACDSKVNPAERSCLSNSGGNLLIASAIFIFIFGFLLMMLTTFPFMLGAPLERFVCKTITDPSLSQLEKWVDGTYNKITVGDGKYFLGNTLYQNSSIPLTLTGILRDCKDNRGAFDAFQLSTQFDITDILNYSKTLDVDAEINAVNVDLSGVEVFPASLETQMDDFKAAVNISFQEFYDELNKDPTGASLSALGDDLLAYASGKPEPYQTNITDQANELKRIETDELANVIANIGALNTSVKAMEDAVSGLPASIDSIKAGLTTTEQYIQNNGSEVVKALLKIYADRLIGIADSYVAYTDAAVKTQLGSCAPIWNVYNAFLVYTFCYNLMDTFNGFWFSLGWCVFFLVPGLIFSIKMAKYLRRMDYVPPPKDDIPPKPDRSLPTPEVIDNNRKPMFKLRKNKVAHYDGTGCVSHTNSVIIPSAPPLNQQEMEHLYTRSNYTNLYPPLDRTDIEHTGRFQVRPNSEMVETSIADEQTGHAVTTDKNYLDNQSQSTAVVSPAKDALEEHKIANQPGGGCSTSNLVEDRINANKFSSAIDNEEINTDVDKDGRPVTNLEAFRPDKATTYDDARPTDVTTDREVESSAETKYEGDGTSDRNLSNSEENNQTKEYINTDWDEDMGSRAQLEASQTKEYISADWDEDMGSRAQLEATQSTDSTVSSHEHNGKITKNGKEHGVSPDIEQTIDTIPPKVIHVEPVSNSEFKTDAETNPI